MTMELSELGTKQATPRPVPGPSTAIGAPNTASPPPTGYKSAAVRRGFAPQHVELMSKDKDLGFQRSPRLEQSDQGAPDQPAKVAHRQRVSADSRSRSAGLSLR